MRSARMVTKNHSTASARPPLGLHHSELLARIRAGESALFEQLMRRYNRSLYRAVRAILADENEVEDTMQQAYVSAFTHLEQFAGRAQFSTWLMQIAINEARGRRRARSVRQRLRERWRTLGLSLRASATLPDALADRQQSRHRLERAIELLPQKYREAFVLRPLGRGGAVAPAHLVFSRLARCAAISISAFVARPPASQRQRRGPARAG